MEDFKFPEHPVAKYKEITETVKQTDGDAYLTHEDHMHIDFKELKDTFPSPIWKDPKPITKADMDEIIKAFHDNPNMFKEWKDG